MSCLVEPTFSLELPPGFQVSRDGERLNCVCRDPAGVLVLLSETVTNPDDLPSLSRMLAGFLTRSGHPVATDELLGINTVPGAYGYSWQYAEGGTFHRFWLFGNEGCWLLLSFLCPQEHQAHFYEPLKELIESVRLKEHGFDG